MASLSYWSAMVSHWTTICVTSLCTFVNIVKDSLTQGCRNIKTKSGYKPNWWASIGICLNFLSQIGGEQVPLVPIRPHTSIYVLTALDRLTASQLQSSNGRMKWSNKPGRWWLFNHCLEMGMFQANFPALSTADKAIKSFSRSKHTNVVCTIW